MGNQHPEGTKKPEPRSPEEDRQAATNWVSDLTKNPEGSDEKPKPKK